MEQEHFGENKMPPIKERSGRQSHKIIEHFENVKLNYPHMTEICDGLIKIERRRIEVNRMMNGN